MAMEGLVKGPILDWTSDGKLHERFLEDLKIKKQIQSFHAFVPTSGQEIGFKIFSRGNNCKSWS